jgi:Mg2+ and Co2+ transporter CorA
MILRTKQRKINFEEYGLEEEKVKDSVTEQQRPNINLYQSKYSPHLKTLDLIHDLKYKLKELGIKIGGDSKTITDLRQFLAILEQLFITVDNFVGKKDYNVIVSKIKTYKKVLRECDRKGYIEDDNINDNLIELQTHIEKLLDHLNLGLEKNKMYSNSNDFGAKIVE